MIKKSTTIFYIVRHGETEWNAKGIIQGHADIPLNKIGIKQIEKLAEKFQSESFDLAFSSDLIRAKHTAEIIALKHKLIVRTAKSLRERDFGKLQGNTSEALTAHTKLLKKLSREQRFKYKMAKDIESDEEFLNRILLFFRQTAISYPNKKILVGAHGGVLRHLLIYSGVLTYEESDKMTIENAGYLVVKSDGKDFKVKQKIGLRPRYEKT